MPKFRTNTIRTAGQALRQSFKPYNVKQKPRNSDRLLIAAYELTEKGQFTFMVKDVTKKVKQQHEGLNDITILGKRTTSCIRRLMIDMVENGYMDYIEYLDEYQMTPDTLEMMEQVKVKLTEIPLCQVDTAAKRYRVHCSLVNGRTGTFRVQRLNLRQMNELCDELESRNPTIPGTGLDDASNIDSGDAEGDIDMEDANQDAGPSTAGGADPISTPNRPKGTRDPALAYLTPRSNPRPQERCRPSRTSPPPSPTRGSTFSVNSGIMNIDQPASPTVSRYANLSPLKALMCHQETVAAILSITIPDPPLELIEETLLSLLRHKDAQIEKLGAELDAAKEQLTEMTRLKEQLEEQVAQLNKAEQELEEQHVTQQREMLDRWQTEKSTLEAQNTILYDEKEVLRQMRDEAQSELSELQQKIRLAALDLLATGRGRA